MRRIDDRASGPNPCDKVMYLSEEAAVDHAVYIRKTHGIEQRVYACPFCGHWHLTTVREEAPR